jgi:hypothetical protein
MSRSQIIAFFCKRADPNTTNKEGNGSIWPRQAEQCARHRLRPTALINQNNRGKQPFILPQKKLIDVSMRS